MADSRDATTPGEEPGPASRALRAGAAAILTAYQAFIAHTQHCQDCRFTGLDCTAAGQLRQDWRTAKDAATP